MGKGGGDLNKMKGKGAKFNGLSGFIKGEDGYTYHFEKEDFRTEEFFKEARWTSKKKLFSKTEFYFIPKKRESGNMQEATDIWFNTIRDKDKDSDKKPAILMKSKSCPSCDKNVSIKYSYCPWCGMKLKQEEDVNEEDSIITSFDLLRKGIQEKYQLRKRYGTTFEQLKYYNSQQISDILVKAHNSGLLAICGGLVDEKDVDECYIALMIAVKMLKTNNLTLPKEYF